MKKFLTLTLLIMVYGIATANAQSLANDILKKDTIYGAGGIKMILGLKNHICQPKIINEKVIQQPTDLVYQNNAPVSGYWLEEWTVKCNNETAVIPIKFILDPTGASWVITENDILFK